MTKEINLLIQRQSKEEIDLSKKIQFLRIFAIGFLFLVTIVSISIFFLIQASPLPNLKARVNQAKESLHAQQKKTVNIIFVSQQLQDIQNILGTRTALEQVVEKVKSITPSTVTVSGIAADKKSMAITLLSPSLLEIDSVFSGVTSFVKAKEIASAATITSLESNAESGEYKVTLTLALLAKK